MHTLVNSLSAERHLPRYLPAGRSCVPPVCGLKLHPSHSRVNLWVQYHHFRSAGNRPASNGKMSSSGVKCLALASPSLEAQPRRRLASWSVTIWSKIARNNARSRSWVDEVIIREKFQFVLHKTELQNTIMREKKMIYNITTLRYNHHFYFDFFVQW